MIVYTYDRTDTQVRLSFHESFAQHVHRSLKVLYFDTDHPNNKITIDFIRLVISVLRTKYGGTSWKNGGPRIGGHCFVLHSSSAHVTLRSSDGREKRKKGGEEEKEMKKKKT
ncbi:hypothetical protein KM043_007754 [Ampulex compressa]|nr:hypothetical protein KM043_007754 [Ampulex compressa]